MKNLAFIDIEATSADSGRADIIEIAFLVKDGENRIVDHFNSLVRPTRPIPAEISELTGITDQMVANAPEFHAVAEKLFFKLSNTRLVAHKAEFDQKILAAKFHELGMRFEAPSLCTLEMSKQLVPGMNSYTLASLCSFFGIPLKKNHRAQEDAEAVAKLFEVLSLLSGQSGQTERKKEFLPGHKKLIDKTRALPGLLTLRNLQGRPLYRQACENLKEELKRKLELNSGNRETIAKCKKVETIETGSMARAMLLKAEREKGPSWSIYSFKDRKGQVIVKCGKVHPKKKALMYFKSKRSAVSALNKIKNASMTGGSYAYKESPEGDRSEVLKRNALLLEAVRKMRPDLENLLIRSKTKVNGLYKYVLIRENDKFAVFDHEEELEKNGDFSWESLPLKEMGPSKKRALELSIQFTRNQRGKTDVVSKIKKSRIRRLS